MLCLFSIPYGLGAGSVDASLNNFVALHYKAHHMSWLHSFWGVGATLGPVIMGQCLINQNSWTLGYVVVSLIQIGLTIFLFCSLSIWKKASKTTEEQKDEIFVAEDGQYVKYNETRVKIPLRPNGSGTKVSAASITSIKVK